MDKQITDFKGYIIGHDLLGVKWDKVYLDQMSANIALREHYTKEDIVAKKARIIPLDVLTYIDLKVAIKIKETCPLCGGLGKIKEEPEEGKKTKMKDCPQCKGEKELWVDRRAIVIY